MFKLLTLLTFISCVYSAALNPKTIRGFSSRILGGDVIEINQAPYQVALLYDSAGIGSFSLKCGGSIGGKDLIVTAANCLYQTSQLRWRIRAGSSMHESGGQLIDVVSYKIHEKYNTETLDSDIAVMKLVSNIEIDNNSTKVVQLAQQDQTILDNTAVTASGWGSFYVGGGLVPKLRAVDLKIINQDACKRSYSSFNTITDNMMCAGDPGYEGKDACKGDTGGPLVADGVLVGIRSFGRTCGSTLYPGIWTRISALRLWIDQNSL